MNQPYARVNQPYATLTLASALREMFGVQLYKNNARALLSRILSILNLDWLQHARSVRGVYEYILKQCVFCFDYFEAFWPLGQWLFFNLFYYYEVITLSNSTSTWSGHRITGDYIAMDIAHGTTMTTYCVSFLHGENELKIYHFYFK